MDTRHLAKPPEAILAHFLNEDGSIPNSRLPLLIYRGALDLPERDPVPEIEKLLASNGWSGSWRDGVYPFHHYHSTTHEVLVCFGGAARVQFGGEQGIDAQIRRGDVVIIPAGVAHKNLGAERDFAVVGAYPGGSSWDMCDGKPGERSRADEEIARVPLPKADPIYGESGPLIEKWGI
jgi:uncharacterized protein YjlB